MRWSEEGEACTSVHVPLERLGGCSLLPSVHCGTRSTATARSGSSASTRTSWRSNVSPMCSPAVVERTWINQRPGYRCRHGHISSRRRAPDALRSLYVREDRLLEWLTSRVAWWQVVTFIAVGGGLLGVAWTDGPRRFDRSVLAGQRPHRALPDRLSDRLLEPAPRTVAIADRRSVHHATTRIFSAVVAAGPRRSEFLPTVGRCPRPGHRAELDGQFFIGAFVVMIPVGILASARREYNWSTARRWWCGLVSRSVAWCVVAVVRAVSEPFCESGWN